MRRTRNTYKTYSNSLVLTSFCEKLMVDLQKSCSKVFYFHVSMNPGSAKNLWIYVCRATPVCIYYVCFLTNTLQITETCLAFLTFLSMVSGSLATYQFTKQDDWCLVSFWMEHKKWLSYINNLSYVACWDNVNRRTESHYSPTLV